MAESGDGDCHRYSYPDGIITATPVRPRWRRCWAASAQPPMALSRQPRCVRRREPRRRTRIDVTRVTGSATNPTYSGRIAPRSSGKSLPRTGRDADLTLGRSTAAADRIGKVLALWCPAATADAPPTVTSSCAVPSHLAEPVGVAVRQTAGPRPLGGSRRPADRRGVPTDPPRRAGRAAVRPAPFPGHQLSRARWTFSMNSCTRSSARSSPASIRSRTRSRTGPDGDSRRTQASSARTPLSRRTGTSPPDL